MKFTNIGINADSEIFVTVDDKNILFSDFINELVDKRVAEILEKKEINVALVL